MTEEYHIGQIFDEMYPPEAAEWCNNNNAYIEEIEPLEGVRRFEIKEVPAETPAQRQARFESQFFYVNGFGWYRRIPKGYSSAVESMNVLFNVANISQGIQAGLIIFYPTPDFTIPEQCTEEWLVSHQIVMPAMTLQEFMQLYVAFMTAWNNQEHVSEEE